MNHPLILTRPGATGIISGGDGRQRQQTARHGTLYNPGASAQPVLVFLAVLITSEYDGPSQGRAVVQIRDLARAWVAELNFGSSFY